jgi:hypothetical protein
MTDEQWMEALIQKHPSLHSDLSEGELAKRLWEDASAIDPELVERIRERWALKELDGLIGSIQRGDIESVIELLSRLPEQTALKVMDAICWATSELAAKQHRKPSKTANRRRMQ